MKKNTYCLGLAVLLMNIYTYAAEQQDHGFELRKSTKQTTTKKRKLPEVPGATPSQTKILKTQGQEPQGTPGTTTRLGDEDEQKTDKASEEINLEQINESIINPLKLLAKEKITEIILEKISELLTIPLTQEKDLSRSLLKLVRGEIMNIHKQVDALDWRKIVPGKLRGSDPTKLKDQNTWITQHHSSLENSLQNKNIFVKRIAKTLKTAILQISDQIQSTLATVEETNKAKLFLNDMQKSYESQMQQMLELTSNTGSTETHQETTTPEETTPESQRLREIEMEQMFKKIQDEQSLSFEDRLAKMLEEDSGL